MNTKKTFIPSRFRPEVAGGKLTVKQGKPIKKCSYSTIKKGTVIIVSKTDPVGIYLIQQKKKGKLLERTIILFLDEINTNWNFSFTQSELKIYEDSNTWIIKSIYIRPVSVSDTHPYYEIINCFLMSVKLSGINIIGLPEKTSPNRSKPLQLATTIKNFSFFNSQLSFPETHIIKKNESSFSIEDYDNFIVKSISSTRCQVATVSDFKAWYKPNISSVPVLFQKIIKGNDLRIHTLDGESWAVSIKGKVKVDYRYDIDTSKHSIIPEDCSFFLKNFCRDTQLAEKNRLTGADFVILNQIAYCLEINPCPGWSSFPGTRRNITQSINKKLNKTESQHEQKPSNDDCNIFYK